MLDPALFLFFYVIIFFMFCLFFIFTIKVRLSAKLFFVILFIISISLVCGLRSQYVGTDTYTFYSLTKLMVNTDSYLWAKDYIYYFLSRLGYQIGGYQVSVLLTSFVTSTALALSIYRIILISFNENDSRSVFMTKTVCLLFVFLLVMSSSDFLMQIANQTRQIMALSLFLLAVSYFYQRKYIFFLLLTVLALYSHHSLILVILSLLIAIRIKRVKYHLLILFISFCLFSSGLSTHVLNAFGLGVSEDSIYSQALNSAASLYAKTAITIALGLLGCYLYYKVEKNKGGDIEALLLKIYLTLASFSILYLGFAEASNRIQRYEGVIFPMLFVLLFRRIKINSLHIVFVFIFSIGYFSFMMSYYSTLKTLGFYTTELKQL